MGNQKRFVYLGLVIIWCFTIFMFSHQPGEKTKETSDIISGPINENIGGGRDWGIFIRKGAHLFEYTLLAFLVMLLVSTSSLQLKYQIPFTFLFCVLYAISDEWHQTFIPGRYGNFTDVLIDAGGCIIGILIYLLIYQIKQKRLRSTINHETNSSNTSGD